MSSMTAPGFNPNVSGGGGIKSIQRGVINVTATPSATATITSVDTAKSSLTILGLSGSNAVTDNPREMALVVRLTNSTTVTAINVQGWAQINTTVSFEVIERY